MTAGRWRRGRRRPTPGAAVAPGAAVEPRVTLLSRPGCHLCDEARTVVTAVVGASGFREVDVDTDAALAARFSEEVPVVLVDGQQISYWTITAERLRGALRR